MKLFRDYQAKGYEVTHKRILGNPKYTSKEARDKDLCQEIALLRQWLNEEKNVWVNVHKLSNGKFFWTIQNLLSLNPKEFFEDINFAYLEAFEYVLQNKLVQ